MGFGQTRCIAYIDGRNMHHALSAISVDGFNYNYRGLVEVSVIDPNKSHHKTISQIKFYGAKFPANVNLEKHHKDDAFYKHLELQQGITVREGRFKVNPEDGKVSEKGVDVLLATDLIADAFYDKYDQAFIFSGDTDLIPAIEFVIRERKKKVIVWSSMHLEIFKLKATAQKLLFPGRLKKFAKPGYLQPTADTVNTLADHYSKGGATNFKKR